MEYSKSNRFPKHDSDFMGAIFMCNALTKKECFRKKLFGLSSVHSDFVKQIKTGMILFLFESDERKLNGIFQATSVGAMNIVPSAFSISKKCFPAQVHFERLCACRPLFESEFNEAIEENYFTATKFSFALSGQQVCRLILLFSSKSYLPYDQLPAGLQLEFMKIFQNSSLARNRVTGNENLPKFDVAGYNMDSNIQPTRNSFLLGRSKNDLTSYRNHEHIVVNLQSHIVRGQRKPNPDVYHSAKLQQNSQVLSTPCNDLKREAISPVIPYGHPSYSSSRFPYQQPSVSSGTDLLEQKLTFYSGSSLDAQTPHTRKQSYASASHLGIKDFPLSNYPSIDISKSSRFSKPSQRTLHAPEGHATFHDFSQKAFYDSYDDLSENNFLHSSPERLHAMASTSLLRNARFNSRPIQQEDDSWNIQDCSSDPDYIPIAKGETLVNRGYIPISEGETLINSGYIPMLEGDLAYAKESFDLPSRKDNSPFALQYDYNSGFTSDTNNTGNGSFDFSYYDKNSVSDLNMLSQSHTIQKRCNVFSRLSRPPKKIKHSSLDHMVEAFYHQRSQGTKYRKFENLRSFETDVPLDDISVLGPFENDSLVETKPRIAKFDDGNGFSFPNFRRRSVAKRQSSGETDFTGCVDKWKRRKIVRPFFSEEDNSSQVKEKCQNHNLPHALHKGHDDHNISFTVSNPAIIGSLDCRIDDSISKMPAEELSLSKNSSDAYREETMSVGHMGPIANNLRDVAGLSSTDYLTVNIQGSQQTLDCDSEVGNNSKFAAKESEKINSCSPMRDENVDGKSKESSCALPLDYIPLSVEEAQEAIIMSSSVSTNSAIASHGLPKEKDAAKHIQEHTLDCYSEVGNNSKFVAKESEKINSCSPMRDENVDGKSKESSFALPLDYIPLSVDEAHEAIIKSSSVSTSSAIASHGLPEEKDAAKRTTRNSLDEDMSHIAVKMDSQDLPPGIRCKTAITGLVCEDDQIKSDGFPETGSSYQC